MVKIVVAIVLESVEDDMSDPSVLNFLLKLLWNFKKNGAELNFVV